MSATETSPTSSKYERRREAILHAAAAVFAEKGFHGASTQDIADRLNMKQGSLYYYFSSKEAALEAVCLYGISESIARLKQVVGADVALPEKIHRIVHSLLYGLKTHCDHRLVFMQQRRFLPAESRARIREQGHEYRRLVVGLLRNAQRDGEIAADLDINLAARALLGLCDSVVPWYQQDDSLDIEAIVDQYARLFYAGIHPERVCA